MATTVFKDPFKTTNMKFSDLDNKFFNLTDAATGIRPIKFSKFIRNSYFDKDPIPEGVEFSFDEDNPQPNDSVVGDGDYTAVTERLSKAYGVLDSTENSGIANIEENLSMSAFKGSITFYRMIQSGLDDYTIHPDGYRIHEQSWNTNLNKLIPKKFEQAADGVMGMQDVTKFACIYRSETKNLQFLIRGSIYGGGASNVNETGGDAMYVDAIGAQSDQIPIRIEPTAKIYAGGGWGGYGGKGGKGGDGGGSRSSKGGIGGAGGARGIGGQGRGYLQTKAPGQAFRNPGIDGTNGGNPYTWYKGGHFTDPNNDGIPSVKLQFTGASRVIDVANGSGGITVQVVGATNALNPNARGFAYANIYMHSWGGSGTNKTGWLTVEGLFAARKMSFVNETDAATPKTLASTAPFLIGGDGSGEIGYSGNTQGIVFPSEGAKFTDKDYEPKKSRVQFWGTRAATDGDGNPITVPAGIATLHLETSPTAIRHRQPETFKGGDAGDGGDGGTGGAGGDWGEPGISGGLAEDGGDGKNSTNTNFGFFTENDAKSNPKFLYNDDDREHTVTIIADLSQRGAGGKDAWGVIMMPIGTYGGEEYFGKPDNETVGHQVEPDIANGVYGVARPLPDASDYTAKSVTIQPGEYVGPISHWSIAPWTKANVPEPHWSYVPVINMVLGGFTKIEPNLDSGRTLAFDDVGAFGVHPTSTYTDLKLTLSGGINLLNGRGVKFVRKLHDDVNRNWIAGELGEKALPPEPGSRGGKAIVPSVGNWKAHFPEDKFASYKSDDKSTRDDPPVPT